MKSARKWFRGSGFRVWTGRCKKAHRQSAFAEVIRLLAGFDETGAMAGRELEPVLDDREMRGPRREARGGLVEADDLVLHQQALVTLLRDEVEGFLEGKLFRQWELKGDQHLRWMAGQRRLISDLLPDQLRRLFAHSVAALAAMKMCEVRPENLHVVA